MVELEPLEGQADQCRMDAHPSPDLIEAAQQLFSCQWFLPGWRDWARLSWFPAPGGGTGTRLEGQEIVTVLRALIAPPQAKPKDSPRPVPGPISKLSHTPLLRLGTGSWGIFCIHWQ